MRRPVSANAQKEVGARLAEARVAAGLSQNEVAAELEMPRPQTIGDWEQGANMGAFELARLCQLYKVSIDWVMGIAQTPSIRGTGGIIDLAVERAVLAARTFQEATAEARRLNAVLKAGIISGYPIPPDFEVVGSKEWKARRDAIDLKLKRLAEAQSGGPSRERPPSK